MQLGAGIIFAHEPLLYNLKGKGFQILAEIFHILYELYMRAYLAVGDFSVCVCVRPFVRVCSKRVHES